MMTKLPVSTLGGRGLTLTCCQSSANLMRFFFNDTGTAEIYPLSLHDPLPISLDHQDEVRDGGGVHGPPGAGSEDAADLGRSEEHTSELQSLRHLVCRLLL